MMAHASKSKYMTGLAVNIRPEFRCCVVECGVAQIDGDARYSMAKATVLDRVVKIRNARAATVPISAEL